MAVLGGMEFCSARRAKVNNPAIHRWGAVATGKVRRDERMGRLGRQEAKRHFFRPYGGCYDIRHKGLITCGFLLKKAILYF